MAQVLTISLQPWQIPRPKKLSLLHMPYEIRKRIYEFTLMEPRLLKRTHSPTCHRRPRRANEVEILPFFCTTTKYDLYLNSSRPGKACQCGKRRGMALLRTCRQIWHEASPVFWSNNTLQFFNTAEFVHRVGTTLRAEQRNQLRSLSLLLRNPQDMSLPSSHHMFWPATPPDLYPVDAPPPLEQRFWRLVGQCGGLDRLEIPPVALHGISELALEEPACGKDGGGGGHDDGPRLLSGSRLSSVKVTQLVPYRTTGRWETDFFIGQAFRGAPVAKFSRVVLLQDVRTLEAVTEARRELEYNFRVHVDTLVKTQFLGATLSDLDRWTVTFRLDPGLHQGDNVRHVVLPTGERTKIEFYGLPISRATRVQMARKKMALDSAQREKNGLSCAQNEVVQRQKKKKKAAQLRKDAQEHHDYQDTLLDRRLRRLDLRDEQRADAKDRQRSILRAIEEAAEVRSKERKRVQPRAPRPTADCAAP
ncbi:hypothetical protein E4U54_001426 [Claviceps lovelessii]|nr:hypothetical protein E4U54_001426 [Claviceps lovelessii]